MERVTKTFKIDTERKLALLWSLRAFDGSSLVVFGNLVSVTFPDVTALVAWAQVHQEYYGWLPEEA